MKKYIIPTVISLSLYLIIVRPGWFNFIPYLIHKNYCRDIIKESNFIYLFNMVFCLIVWILFFLLFKMSEKKHNEH